MINNDVGYILLEHFYFDAGKEVRDALQDLKNKHNPKSVILDLRGNPGGLLNEAVNVSNAFIDKDENVVFTKGKVEEWDKSFKTMMSAIDKEIPLVVLTNSGSASASEIVSGSIQDLDRGVLVGQLTYGKGLVQTTRPLSYNTKLKVTTAKYYIPSGRCIQAINYAEKGPEGEVKKIPDSLKVAFKTRAGRVVYDGGGVEPDVKTEPEMLSLIAIALLDKNLIFNYATQYRAKHPSINKAIEFKLSDAEFEDFVAYISKNDYEYKTESEKTLNELEKISKEEKYYDAIKAQIIELYKTNKNMNYIGRHIGRNGTSVRATLIRNKIDISESYLWISQEEEDALVAFMTTLSDGYVPVFSIAATQKTQAPQKTLKKGNK
jgi:carboxyl-terminal processing protease